MGGRRSRPDHSAVTIKNTLRHAGPAQVCRAYGQGLPLHAGPLPADVDRMPGARGARARCAAAAVDAPAPPLHPSCCAAAAARLLLRGCCCAPPTQQQLGCSSEWGRALCAQAWQRCRHAKGVCGSKTSQHTGPLAPPLPSTPPITGAPRVGAGGGAHERGQDGGGRVCDRNGVQGQAARRLHLPHQGARPSPARWLGRSWRSHLQAGALRSGWIGKQRAACRASPNPAIRLRSLCAASDALPICDPEPQWLQRSLAALPTRPPPLPLPRRCQTRSTGSSRQSLAMWGS